MLGLAQRMRIAGGLEKAARRFRILHDEAARARTARRASPAAAPRPDRRCPGRPESGRACRFERARRRAPPSAAVRSSDHRDAFVGQHGGELDQRQPDEGARVVVRRRAPPARCPSPRSWRCPRNRTAARARGNARSRGRCRRESAPSSAPWRAGCAPLAVLSSASAVWNTTSRPRIAFNCATACGVAARLAEARAVERRHLVAADHERGGRAMRRPRAPSPRPAAARGPAAASAGQRGLVHGGRSHLERQPQSLEQRAPVRETWRRGSGGVRQGGCGHESRRAARGKAIFGVQ